MSLLQQKAFFDALETGDVRVVELTATNGFDCDCCHPETGITALQASALNYLSESSHRNMAAFGEVSRWLVSHGANPNKVANPPLEGVEQPTLRVSYWSHTPGITPRTIDCPVHGQSAVSLLAMVLRQMKALEKEWECTDCHAWWETHDVESVVHLMRLTISADMPQEGKADSPLDVRTRAFFDAIETGSIANVELVTRTDFNVDSCHPETGITALQAVALRYISEYERRHSFAELARWLLQRGAHPDKRAEKHVRVKPPVAVLYGNCENRMKDEKVVCKSDGQSTRSMLSRLILEMTELEQACVNAGWFYWEEHNIQSIQHLMDIVTATVGSCQMMSVAMSVVDFWGKIRAAKSKHDLIITGRDGTTTGYSMILAAASPVVAAMLASGMNETTGWQITVDCPIESVSYVLDLLHTGKSGQEFTTEMAVASLDLAHRWQLSGVVDMLEQTFLAKICLENFAQVAETAVLKGLEQLRSACVRFARENPEVGERELPSCVTTWLPSREALEGKLARQQRFAY
mmetsp:Transcript_52034/g.96356  ORF Transcript_52034/g.96356 Transcript_52034/m.96356 type:complete len:520 (-) Transcript_52034:132-1691(-)